MIGREKGFKSLCVKCFGLLLDILTVSMAGVFSHVCFLNRTENLLFSYSKVMLFPCGSVQDCGEDFFLFIQCPFCFRIVAFGTVLRISSFLISRSYHVHVLAFGTVAGITFLSLHGYVVSAK